MTAVPYTVTVFGYLFQMQNGKIVKVPFSYQAKCSDVDGEFALFQPGGDSNIQPNTPGYLSNLVSNLKTGSQVTNTLVLYYNLQEQPNAFDIVQLAQTAQDRMGGMEIPFDALTKIKFRQRAT